MASAAIAQSSGTAGAPEVFFDADTTKFSRDGKIQILEGNVAAIGAGVLVAADRIEVNRRNRVSRASGHIVVLTTNQAFIGNELHYNMANGDFLLEEGLLVANDSDLVSRISRNLLGFTQAELDFEAARKERLKEIAVAKSAKKDEYRRAFGVHPEGERRIVDEYALLLEKQEMIASQRNQALDQVSESQREDFERRREFWKSRKAALSPTFGGAIADSYFRIEGSQLSRTDSNNYSAQEAFWTTCKCQDGELPDWGFRAELIEAQVGGYIDFDHAVLEIKGVPILYLPFLRLPVKSKRQSGFLPPMISYKPRSGNVFSQPVFFAMSDHNDATFTSEWIEKRGTRLGAEYRHKTTMDTGWSLNLDFLKDRLWQEDISARRDVHQIYQDGLSEARRRQTRRNVINQKIANGDPLGPEDVIDTSDAGSVWSPEYWSSESIAEDGLLGNCMGSDEDAEDCRSGLKRRFATPINDWRGQIKWQGLTFFAPRLSLAAEGEIASDHRYADELGFATTVNEAISNHKHVKSFSRVKWRTHLDARNFYLGVGSLFGDSMASDSRFVGYQVPLNFKAQSRLFWLTPREFVVPVYGQLMYESRKIGLYQDESTAVPVDEASERRLGDGVWQRQKVDVVAPLLTETVVTVDYFLDLEARQISHEGLEGGSSINSWLTGFNFYLPMEGESSFPASLWPADPGFQKHAQHTMDWRMTLAARPAVVREGAYGETRNVDGSGARFLTYYASDLRERLVDKNFLGEQDAMVPESKVILSTNHAWSFFDRGWALVPSSASAPADKGGGESDSGKRSVSYQERALEELLYSTERSISDPADFFDANGRWKIDRFAKTERNRITPIQATARIDYDFIRAKLHRERAPVREDQIQSNKDIEQQIAVLQASANPDSDQIDALRSQLVSLINVPEPWSTLDLGLKLRYRSWALTGTLDFDLALDKARQAEVAFSPPGFWDSGIAFGYKLKISSTPDLVGGYEDSIEKHRSVSFSTGLIPRVSTGLILEDKTNPGIARAAEKREELTGAGGSEHYFKDNYQSTMTVAYADPSDCWSLTFGRLKKFGKHEREANYFLKLNIVFGSQSRPFDFSGAVERNLPFRDESQGG